MRRTFGNPRAKNIVIYTTNFSFIQDCIQSLKLKWEEHVKRARCG